MKKCNKCKELLPLKCFSKHTSRGVTRLRAHCRKCASRLFKQYYKKNREKLLKIRRNYSKLKYQQDKGYYKKENQKYISKWRKNNPLKHRAISQRRRARIKNAKGSFSYKDLEIIYRKQKGQCYYCEISLDSNFHVDHKIPLSKNGTNFPANLALTCSYCNLSKKDKTSSEYFEKRKTISFGSIK